MEAKLISLEEGIELDALDREELKEICKKNGIRANIKTSEMRDVLKRLRDGFEIDSNFYRKSWLSEHKKLVGGVGSCTIIFIIFLFLLLTKDKNIPSSPPVFNCVNSKNFCTYKYKSKKMKKSYIHITFICLSLQLSHLSFNQLTTWSL